MPENAKKIKFKWVSRDSKDFDKDDKLHQGGMVYFWSHKPTKITVENTKYNVSDSKTISDDKSKEFRLNDVYKEMGKTHFCYIPYSLFYDLCGEAIKRGECKQITRETKKAILKFDGENKPVQEVKREELLDMEE